MHRLHSTDTVHGCWRHAPHHAVWGNPRVAPPRGQVAEHPLPPLWLTQYSLPVRDSKNTGHGPKCHRTFPRKQVDRVLWFYSFVYIFYRTVESRREKCPSRKRTAHPGISFSNCRCQECTNVLLLNRFCIPGGSYPQSCAQGCYSTDSSENKENWGWQLIWRTANSDEQWQSYYYSLIFYVTCLQSVCGNQKKRAQPAQIWAEIFEANQAAFISAVNSPKKTQTLSFLYMLQSALLYSTCAQLGQMTLSFQCELWPPLALLPSMQRIVGKNSKKAWLLVEQAKCAYWSQTRPKYEGFASNLKLNFASNLPNAGTLILLLNLLWSWILLHVSEYFTQ